jgi:tetratricopeptide (TPR) repeat protein
MKGRKEAVGEVSTTPKRRSPRSRARLEAAAAEAQTYPAKAVAHFELALFHDNNSREAEAIPHYEAALAHGLDGERHAECLAWLASSLYKTGKPDDAKVRLAEALAATSDRSLLRFLARLDRRIELERLTETMRSTAQLLLSLANKDARSRVQGVKRPGKDSPPARHR